MENQCRVSFPEDRSEVWVFLYVCSIFHFRFLPDMRHPCKTLIEECFFSSSLVSLGWRNQRTQEQISLPPRTWTAGGKWKKRKEILLFFLFSLFKKEEACMLLCRDWNKDQTGKTKERRALDEWWVPYSSLLDSRIGRKSSDSTIPSKRKRWLDGKSRLQRR